MGTVKPTIKRWNIDVWDTIYPKTTMDQVVNLNTTLADIQSDIEDNKKKIFSMKVSGTNGATGYWKATHSDITSYFDGMTIALFTNNYAGTGSGTRLNINDLGDKMIYYNDNSSLTTHYGPETLIMLYYDSAQDRFYCHDFYYSSEDYNLRWENDIQVGTLVNGYQLLLEGTDGKFHPVTEGGSTNNTNAVSTKSFKLGGIMLEYESSTDIAADAIITDNYLWEGDLVYTMEYWNNRDSGWAIASRPVYLVAEVQSDGSFKLDNSSYTSFLTQDLPTSEDGKIYIQIGIMHDTYDEYRLTTSHPIYEYRNGKIRLYSPDDEAVLFVPDSSNINNWYSDDRPKVLHKNEAGWNNGGTKPTGSSNAVGIFSLKTHSGNYSSQLAFDSTNNKLWIRSATTSGYGSWEELSKQNYIDATNIGKVGSVSLVTLSSASAWANLPIGKMIMVNSSSTGKPSWASSYGYVIKGPARDMSGGGSWIWIDYNTGEICAGKSGDSSTYPTWTRTSFQLEDGDGTEVTISPGKELKFVEGGGIDINLTDTSTGSDGDPYDLTFKVKPGTATETGGAKFDYSGGVLTIDVT